MTDEQRAADYITMRTGPGFRSLPEVRWLPREPDTRPWYQFWGAPKQRLELLSDLVYQDSRGDQHRVPSGFTTDLASVPKLVPGIVRLFFSDTLESGAAAILHDADYAGELLTRNRLGWAFSMHSRSEADWLFADALEASGESQLSEWLMWGGVRVGGWVAWGKHRKGKG